MTKIRIIRTFTDKGPPYRTEVFTQDVEADDFAQACSKAYYSIGRTYLRTATRSDIKLMLGITSSVFRVVMDLQGDFNTTLTSDLSVCKISTQVIRRYA